MQILDLRTVVGIKVHYEVADRDVQLNNEVRVYVVARMSPESFPNARASLLELRPRVQCHFDMHGEATVLVCCVQPLLQGRPNGQNFIDVYINVEATHNEFFNEMVLVAPDSNHSYGHGGNSQGRRLCPVRIPFSPTSLVRYLGWCCCSPRLVAGRARPPTVIAVAIQAMLYSMHANSSLVVLLADLLLSPTGYFRWPFLLSGIQLSIYNHLAGGFRLLASLAGLIFSQSRSPHCTCGLFL